MEPVLLHGTLHVTIYEARKVFGSGCSKFCCQILENIDNTHPHSDPQWFESFHIYCAHLASNVIFSVKEDNPIEAVVIGKAYLPVAELLDGKEVDKWLEILYKTHRTRHKGSKIHVRVQFFDATKRHNWSKGIESPKFPGVPYTFFSQRSGCRVTLYQDAHVPDKFIPEIPLAGGKHQEQHRCWEDIFDAIFNAKHLIYITGWSVYTKITLLLKKDGLMATHDEDTGGYFRDTKVHCVLCPRNPDDGQSIIQDIEISTMFTHHQKTLVVDSELPGGEPPKRRIVSFIGGIDLCDGRYDTPFHPIFRTLDTVHRNDFRQPDFCRDGESKVMRSCFFNQENLTSFLHLHLLLCYPKTMKHGMFNCSGRSTVELLLASLKLLKMQPESGSSVGGIVSLIEAFRMLISMPFGGQKTFVYIENQYFLGSSFSWKSDDVKVEEVGASHLIPKELSLKIVSKIKSGERFSVYVVIPMWPEGIPESGSVQAILNWQKRTMEMMYSDIAEALRDKGLEANPKDYLTFFCLGKHEREMAGEYVPSEKPAQNSDYSRAQKSRRFMIYVHAKMMIVDDEYIITGSANINQRSMDGGRDTEIAMGAYQPYHLATKQPARGQIHGFRMSLWYEHLGQLDDTFCHPESLECVRKVNHIAGKYWHLYSSGNDLPGHLLTYPMEVTSNGDLTELQGTEFFPDTKARVFGSKSDLLPSILIT
ncbi:hypothetical protein OIU84_000973 [Salix udensis]|uniref:Phospholipase D n=1 Tax=Salix udensis TaxID=889485 RepID=A0AAD6PMX4_9ROSI|nr:hypothetical protein OIU84_000973 [Salix udensis]